MEAQEQLGHFRGEVYTSVRPIMERLAGRPIRLARVPGRGKKNGKRKSPSHFLQKWFQKSSLLAGGAEAREVEIIDQHPVLDAIHDPAPSIVGWTNWHLKAVSIASLCCTGHAYWWFPVVEGRTEIWYLPPDWVWPINARDKLNVGWTIRPPHCDAHEVPREAITPFWFPDPASPLKALGPLEAGARGVLISEFLEECQKRHFQLGPHPTAVVTLGGLQTKDGQTVRPRLKQWQINQIRDAFDMRYANVFNSGRTVVLDALIDKFEPWSNQPHTMSYGENADTARRRVRQNFGTSDYAVGEGSLGSRAESAESDYHFCENTLNPKCELLSRVLTGCVLPVFDDDPSLILFIEPCEPHDSEQKAADYQFAAKTGIININDFLVHRLGMDPVSHGENYLVPTTYTVRTPDQMTEGFTAAAAAAAGAPGSPQLGLPAPTQPAIPTGPVETPEDEDEPLADGDAPEKSAPRLKKNDTGSDDASADFRKRYIATWLKTHGERETVLSAAMLDLQRQQADAVAAALVANYDDNSLKAATAGHIAANIFDPQGWVGKLKEAARTPLLYAWLSGASNELSAFGLAPNALPPPADAAANQKASRRKDADLGFDFGVELPDDVKDGISAGIEKSLSQPYWGWIEETKRDDLQAFLEQALDDGKPMTEIVKDVRAVFDGAIGKDRALTIARTETTGALNGGAHEAQKHLADEGIVDGKEWLDTADARTRATHLTAGGQTVGVNDKFMVGGYAADYPGDAALPAKERVHCRCATTSVTSFAGRTGEKSLAPAAEKTACDAREKSGWPYEPRGRAGEVS